MAPGPVPISPNVLNSLSRPIVHHRTPEFQETLKRSWLGLKEVFQSETQPVLIVPGTGSAAMEAALINTLSPGDEVLCLVNGKFGQRWRDMANNFGLNAHQLNFEWGQPVNTVIVEQFLADHPQVKAVLCQAVETSTGTLNPIEQLGPAIKKSHPQALFLVDGITAMGVTPLSMKTPGVDIIVAGSQKAFMLPTGMSFICFSNLAWEKNKTSKLPKYYFDLYEEKVSNEKKQTRFSSLVTHITALEQVLKLYTGPFLCRRILYSQDSSFAFRKAITTMGLSLFSQAPAPSLTAVKVPDSVDGLQLRSDIEQKFHITLMGGQDHLKGKIIRIGHMGYIFKNDYCQTLTAIKEALQLQGYEIKSSLFEQALKEFKIDMGSDYDEYFNH